MTAGASWHFHNTKTTLPYHSGLQDEYVPELLSGKILKDPLNCHKQWFQKWKIHVRIPRIWTNHGFNMFQTFPSHCFFRADPQDGRLGRGLEVLQRGACPELVAVPGFQVPAEDQVSSGDMLYPAW